MKKHILYLLLCILIILTGCSTHTETAESDHETQVLDRLGESIELDDETQALDRLEESIESDNEIQASFYDRLETVVFSKENNWIDSIGIAVPNVSQKITLKTDNGTYPLYHIYDEAAIENKIYYLYSYIAVEKDSQILLFKIRGSYGTTIYACDIDGDKADEIIIQQPIGMSGGAGQFRSTVVKMSGDEFSIIFSSRTNDLFDTGFECVAQDGFKLLISNRFTEYEKVISFAHRKTHYIGVYYDETGKVIRDCRILCDSFCEFYPEDVDGDGVFELVCLQYVSLKGHSDHIGDAYSVLKFSNDTNQFEVVSCEFRERIYT